MSFSTKLSGLRSIWWFDNRYQVLLSRLLFRKRPVIYVIRDKEILIDHSAGDANGTREVITSRMYKQFLSAMVLPPAVSVLDVGANGGGFPLLLELNDIRIKKLVCVELNPNTYRRLRFNIERNIACQFTGMNVAACGTTQDYEIFLGQGGTSDSLYRSHHGRGKVYRITGMTLDDIYDATFRHGTADICKMDIEGAEYEIFDFPHHASIANFRYLIIEIHSHPQRSRTEVIKKIQECGFCEVSKDAKQDIFLFHKAE